MANGVGWDLLYNGSMVRAAWEVYDGTAALNGFAFGTLYILFQVLLFSKTKKPLPGVIIGLFFLVMYQSNQFFSFLTIHSSIFWVVVVVLVVETAAMIIGWILKHGG